MPGPPFEVNEMKDKPLSDMIKMRDFQAIILLSLSILCFVPSPTDGAIINSASCSQAAVQSAIDAAQNGDTVVIPAGSCTWNSQVSISKGITIQGGGENATVLDGNTDVYFKVNGTGGHFRLTGIGFHGGASWAFITLDGTFTSLRVDHSRFSDIPGSRGIVVGYYSQDLPAIKGVFDHLTATSSSWKIFLAHYGTNSQWLAPDEFGTDNALYVEDGTFTGTAGATIDVIDGECGARFVVRHNRITNGLISYHDTGSTPQCRSTRAVEIYDNTFSCTTADCGWGAISFRGGTGIYFNNVIPRYPNGYENGATTEIYRVSYPAGGKPWTHACDNVADRVCSDFRSHCTGGDKRACGGDYDCPVGTCSVDACTQDSECGSGATCLPKFDGQLDPIGWPCRDQTGRGQDDPVTHVQASSPAYWWNNTDLSGKQMEVLVADADANYIKPERDYYGYKANFNGASGVGMGARALRPASCTAGVGYWATDENKLYKCTVTNTWSLFYTPYTYPHPLRGSDGGDTIPPSSPKNLRIR